jgi:hypothetical protein
MPWSTPNPPGKQPPGPPLAPEEMDLLVARADLTLNPGQMADLVLAWRQLGVMIASLPRRAVLDEDRSGVFRLPPPPPAAKPIGTKAPAGKAPAGKAPVGKAPVGTALVGKAPVGGKAPAGKPARRG